MGDVERLERENALLRAILDHLPAAVYVKDLDGRYLLANPRALELKGAGILGRTDREIFPPPTADAIAQHDGAVLAARRPIEFDEIIPAPAGATTQLSFKFPIFGGAGAPTALGGISTDITERKWVETLAEAERRALEQAARGGALVDVLRVLVDAIEKLGIGAIASILLLDRDGVHLRDGASSQALPAEYVRAIDGLPIGVLAGSCGTAASRREQVIVPDIASDPRWESYRHLALPHGLRACWSTPIFNARGEVLGTFAVYYREPRSPPPSHLRVVAQLTRTVSVILERQRAEQERARLIADLADANARHQSLFDGTAEAILVIASDGRYIDANRAASTLTGYAREELCALRVGDLASSAGEVRERWQRIAGEGRFAGEWDLRRKDGTLVPVETRVAPVRLPSGPVFVSTMRDITERRALERLRRDFLAVVGHELRNPLNSIVGSAELMRATGQYSARAVDRIARQARQLERLLGDLQEAHNIEAGTLRLRTRQVDLLPLLRSCVEEASATTGNHTLRLESAAPAVEGVWDGDRLCQVVRNLLSNAIKYSPGGDVVVRVAPDDRRVRISVSDEGPGIPPETLRRLFERYFRAPETAAAVPGLGVGLSVCKELVERHGGTLSVESVVGRGTTFTIDLPRA